MSLHAQGTQTPSYILILQSIYKINLTMSEIMKRFSFLMSVQNKNSGTIISPDHRFSQEFCSVLFKTLILWKDDTESQFPLVVKGNLFKFHCCFFIYQKQVMCYHHRGCVCIFSG